MRLLRRDTEESVARRLTEAGAPRETADAIVATLLGCGLSPREAREWLSHPELSYPIKLPFEMPDGSTMMLSQHADRAGLEGRHRGRARRGAGVRRRAAGGTADRAAVLGRHRRRAAAHRAATRTARRSSPGSPSALLQRLRKPELVCNVGQTVLPGHGGKRMVDRLAAGEADAVAAELADGRIDARALERNGELIFTGW